MGPGGCTGINGRGFNCGRGLTTGGGLLAPAWGKPTASIKRRIRSSSVSGATGGRGPAGRGGGVEGGCWREADIAFEMATMAKTMKKKNRCTTAAILYFTSSWERSGPAMVSRILVSASTLRIFM